MTISEWFKNPYHVVTIISFLIIMVILESICIAFLIKKMILRKINIVKQSTIVLYCF